MTSARENSHGNGAELPRVPSIPLSDDAAAPGDQSIGGLVKDATTHLSTLIRGELELAKSEVAGEVKKGLTGSVYFIIALVLLLLFIPFGLVALSLGLNDIFDWEAHPWLGFLIVFVVAIVGAALLVFLGIKKFKRIRAPQRTIDSAKDTIAALRPGGDGKHGELEPRRP
ncbi:phage holin family protein [Actinophytocola algeriensis]|uniref:Putative integral membrane protein n=1 Tax=Actinophytocola algeriensis TaxID=1768010 RepID=A0A7W7Q545_9PSEU|nr:phage holin family protein [Actinophytocola algeriensis]MBB4907164.1 putative integral membrane protein [Actinophytocola algeriensis]MBE1478647.1 putative integral membrane protein [Actinophytocola algeriensis]